MPAGGFATIAALGAVSAAPKLLASWSQSRASQKLKLQDTRPASFLEKQQLARQAAAAGALPGQAMQQARLGMVQNGALQSARLGAASGSDFLASAGAADARRMSGEQQLGTQFGQYTDQARQRLGQVLDQDAAYRTKDLDTFNRTKAALTQSAAENLDNGLGTLASYGAQGVNMGLASKAAGAMGGVGATSPYASPYAPDLYPQTGGAYLPGQVMGLNRPRYNSRLGY
jgi:hypothetical protein